MRLVVNGFSETRLLEFKLQLVLRPVIPADEMPPKTGDKLKFELQQMRRPLVFFIGGTVSGT